MRGLIILAVLGAGGYYAYSKGLLPQLTPFVGEAEKTVSRWRGEALQEDRRAAREERVSAIREASGGRVLPVLGEDETVSVNEYEAMLRLYMGQVSGWARQNIGWAAAILRVENAPRNPLASGDNGTSHGVGQVKVVTAETCYRAGYSSYEPTEAVLKTYEGGIYFATAEMERLSKINGDVDWIIQAYNGGAGFAQMGATYVRDRGRYLAKVKKAFIQLYGQGAMV